MKKRLNQSTCRLGCGLGWGAYIEKVSVKWKERDRVKGRTKRIKLPGLVENHSYVTDTVNQNAAILLYYCFSDGSTRNVFIQELSSS